MDNKKISYKEMSEYVAQKMGAESGEPVDAKKLECPTEGEMASLIIAYHFYKVRDIKRTEKLDGELTFGDSKIYVSPLNGLEYKLSISKSGYILVEVSIDSDWYYRGLGQFATKWNYTVDELVELMNVGQIWDGTKWITDFRDVKD